MRKIRDVLRLSRAEGLSPRQIARSLSLPRITVRRYLARATLAQLPWPLPAEMDDQELEKRLYGPPPPPCVTRPLPDWPEIHQEQRNKDICSGWNTRRSFRATGISTASFAVAIATGKERWIS